MADRTMLITLDRTSRDTLGRFALKLLLAVLIAGMGKTGLLIATSGWLALYATFTAVLAIAFRQSLSHMSRDKPDDEWVAKVRRLADRLGLEPSVVAQIERDGPLAVELAERLGCRALPWLDDNHARQEERLREVYRDSALVLSDRLHAVVIAATEGAVPIALSSGPMDKVSRTLEGAGIHATSVRRDLGDESAFETTVDDALARRAEIMDAVVDARRRLTAVTDQLRTRLAAKGKLP